VIWQKGSARLPARIILVSVCIAVLAAKSQGAIRYDVSLAHPEQHLFHVAMEISDVPGSVTLQMPAWDALYQIRDFGAHIQEVQASDASGGLPIEKLDKQSWRVTGSGSVTVRYAIYWDEGGPFATQLNNEHSFINPAMILMYAPERRSETVRMSLSNIPAGWNVATACTNPAKPQKPAGAFLCDADNYDALADEPFEIGRFTQFQISGSLPEIWVAVHGDGWKRERIEAELHKICQYELKLMDSAPFERYIFLIHLGKSATGVGGGMEHNNSTAISARSQDELADVAAHEFFHLWNVKRIRPASLEPVDYTKEQYTRALWFAEGVTSSYASYTLVRAGLWNKDQFYEDLAAQIGDLESRPAYHWQSAEQSSLDAWLEKYPLYNRGASSVSYYTKGQVLGVLLDIAIRDRSENEKSLDDVFRTMNVDFARAGKTYRDSLDIRLTAEKVAGGSFEEFFRHYISGVEPLPYSQLLSLAGLELRRAERKRLSLGFLTDRDAAGTWTVQNVDSDSPAAQAGLLEGDVIAKWNGVDPPRSPERWLSTQKKGATLRLNVRRDETSLTLEFRPGEVPEVFYRVLESPGAGPRAIRIREGLLHGITQPVRAEAQPAR
jgi:predicted metalloprotease with PDZ domain